MTEAVVVTRHWKLWITLVLLLLLLGVGIVHFAHDSTQVPAYNRLKLGMSLSEVEKAIGIPAGDYRTEVWPPSMSPIRYVSRRGVPFEPWPNAADDNGKLTMQRWEWDEYGISVVFEGGKVVGCLLYQVVRGPDGLPAE